MRGLDFYLVQDFASSIDDFTQSILLDDTFFPAYFMRALVRYKQLEYKKAEAGMNEGVVSGAQEVKKAEVTAMDYDIVKNDLDHVIQFGVPILFTVIITRQCIVAAERLPCGIGGLRQGNRTESRFCRSLFQPWPDAYLPGQ